ncbi:DUF2149 domain-containing protein [Desulfosarcina ovata]|uniref:DUF2149 domain-containing protein n=1 Tax=Desulfosarcina ovata subsp. ovata TaxID=2752305 RepID=A0A5K8AIJ2_9BACT|nr:DUF2149 domain-containing protein [Desulfosarcina ovata]BBO92487.1 hypothetical protein DSCOOX_56670 [Desulfosarcina ovata subsp. ovata]
MRSPREKRRNRRPASAIHQEDPMSAAANLFDVAMVFAVGLMVAMVSAYHLHELFTADELTMIKNPNQPGKMEIITKKGKEIKVQKLTKEMAQGQGTRLGTAYRLKTGKVVYIPEEEER